MIHRLLLAAFIVTQRRRTRQLHASAAPAPMERLTSRGLEMTIERGKGVRTRASFRFGPPGSSHSLPGHTITEPLQGHLELLGTDPDPPVRLHLDLPRIVEDQR